MQPVPNFVRWSVCRPLCRPLEVPPLPAMGSRLPVRVASGSGSKTSACLPRVPGACLARHIASNAFRCGTASEYETFLTSGSPWDAP